MKDHPMELIKKTTMNGFRSFLSRTSKEYAIIYILLGLFILLSIVADYFLTGENQINIVRQGAIFGILAAGEFFVIITGMIDLSIGSTAALAGIIFTMIVKAGGIEMMPVAILVGLLVGLVVGLINGLLVSRLNIPPFIATLGTYLAVRGVVYMSTNAYPIVSLDDGFNYIGRSFILGVPVPVLIMILVYIVAIVLSEKKKTGRFFYAIGGNEEAAYLSGINVANIKTLSFTVCGVMSAIAGIILMSRLASGQPNAAIGYEFEAIIAVVLGGVSFAGGKGKALNVLFGTLFIAMLVNGMTLMNINPFAQQIIKGVVFIVAIWNDVIRNRIRR
jgi:ribose/xylose/arabinose/galactoside ABC-type transport system permease subunit